MYIDDFTVLLEIQLKNSCANIRIIQHYFVKKKKKEVDRCLFITNTDHINQETSRRIKSLFGTHWRLSSFNQ